MERNEGYIIKIMKNTGNLGRGFDTKPLFEFRGSLKRFSLKSFEKRLKAIEKEHGILHMSFAAFLWGMTVRFVLAL